MSLLSGTGAQGASRVPPTSLAPSGNGTAPTMLNPPETGRSMLSRSQTRRQISSCLTAPNAQVDPEKTPVEFMLSPTQRLDVFVTQATTVSQTKELIAADAQSKFGIFLDPQRGFDLKLPGAPFLTDDKMRLLSLPYVVNCRHRGRTPIFLVLDKRSEITRDYKSENMTIGAIIGHSLAWTLKHDEITEYRQSMAKQRYDTYMAAQQSLKEYTEEAPTDSVATNGPSNSRVSPTRPGASRERFKSTLPINLASAPPKTRLPAASVIGSAPLVTPATTTTPTSPPASKYLIKLRHDNSTFSTIAVNLATDSADQVISKCFASLMRSAPDAARGKKADEFVLKPIGLATYIHGPMLFSQFKAINENVMAKKETQVDLIERAPLEDQEKTFGDSLPQASMSLEERLWEYTEVTASYVHSKIAIDRVVDPWKKAHVLSVYDISSPLSVRILGVDNLYLPPGVISESNWPNTQISLRCALYEGSTPISDVFKRNWVSVPPMGIGVPSATVIFPLSQGQIEWGSRVPLLRDLPRATQLCFTLCYRMSPNDPDGVPIAWVNKPLFDHNHELSSGNMNLDMWRADDSFERFGDVNPRGTARPNYSATQKGLPTLYLQFPKFALPVVFPTSATEGKGNAALFPSATSMTVRETRIVKRIVSGYPIDVLTSQHKHLLWKTRDLLKATEPKALSKFLQSIPMHRNARLEALRLMKIWNVGSLNPAEFLELLDAKFADPSIRAFAVDHLEALSDEDIGDYLLQFIQALRYEPYLDCALSRFLLRRSVANPFLGHYLFWYLKSELHNEETFERNGLLLEAYLRACTPTQRAQLGLQTQLVQSLLDIQKVILKADKDDKLPVLRAELHRLNQNLFNNFALSPVDKTQPLGANYRHSVSAYTSNPSRRSTLVRENSEVYGSSSGEDTSRRESVSDTPGHSPNSALTSILAGTGGVLGPSVMISHANGDSSHQYSDSISGTRSPSSPSSPRTGMSPLSDSVLGPTLERQNSRNLGPITIKLPLNPLVEVSGVFPEKCKVMKSKKEPLWLNFQNADSKSGPYLTMFKAGDDLRQDMLVLQLFRIMDRLWRANGLNLDMAIYSVLSTGDQNGFVEVVTQSKTISEIQGLSAFKDEVLFNFILEHNGGQSALASSSTSTAATSVPAKQQASSGSSSKGSSHNSSTSLSTAKPTAPVSPNLSRPIEQPITVAVGRFVRSCAACCVATYVLGIGDRHNGNVMIREDGTFFHIDFGHMLGNFKEKLGIRRERVPFVFTPEMVYVMGNKEDAFYVQFVELCCRAYNQLRMKATLFMNLFAMMMSSGMPELQTAQDLFYLKDTLDLDLTSQQAEDKFKDLLEDTSKAISTRVNWFIHNLAQRLK